jgi:hypothetical protein
MLLNRTSRAHRIASMCVVALLAANGAVLATGLADAVETLTATAPARTIALITMPDGSQVAVDPTTPAGWKAIEEAKKNGATVTTVAVSDKEAAATRGANGSGVTIPGINTTDLQQLLTGKVDEITTTVRTIVDSTGNTVVSIVGDATSTVSSIVGDEVVPVVTTIQNTATSLQNTVTSIANSTPTTIQNTVTTIQDTATTLPDTVTTLPDTVTTVVETTPTTIENTVTSLQTTVTTILGALP